MTAVDFSEVALDKGRRIAGDADVDWVVADATTWRPSASYDLAVIAYLQLSADGRRAAVRTAYDALAPGGTFLLVAHDTTNLVEGTGGPQDASVLMTADDVLADLADRDAEIIRAERVTRAVTLADGTVRDALDTLVRLRRPG